MKTVFTVGVFDLIHFGLVMAVNRKGQMVPAWEFAESYSVVADGKVIKEHQFATDYYFYLSAEDGTLINQ